MITPELKIQINLIEQLLTNVDAVLKNQIREIYQMPKDDRKPYLVDYFTIKDYIDEAWDCIVDLHNELDKRPTVNQYKQVQTMLTNAREYIKILGGNPHNITYA